MKAAPPSPMSHALRWKRLEDLFDGALAVSPDERTQWIAEHCPDESLRSELAEMLSAHARVTGILDQPVPSRIETVRARMSAALAGHYTIEQVLGVGGSASVFRAREHKHDRQVVLKVLHPDIAAQIGVRRFLAEVCFAAQLSHPHILPLIDSGEADGLLYYIMPSVNGETLRERLSESRVIPVRKAVTLLRDIADALATAHEAGIIHRDLKPENVLCVGDHAFLLDFGIAVHESRWDRRHTGEGMIVGTPGYMSPEQASGDVIDSRSDVYAWGVLANEMLTARTPAEIEQRGTVPRALLELIDRARSHEPDDRPRDGAALLEALYEIDAISSRPARTQGAIRRPIGIAVAAIVLLTTAVVAWNWRSGTVPVERGAGLVSPVAVATLRNETGDSTLDIWGRMASDWLTQGLHETARVQVVPWTAARLANDSNTTGTKPDELAAFARETGAATVVSGRYYLMGDRVQFRIDVVDVASGDLIATLPAVEASRDSVDSGIRELRERLMGVIAVRLDERLEAFPGLAEHPPTFNAYLAFDRGLELYNAQQYGPSAAEFRHAWSLDTSFATPLIYAAMAHWNQDDFAWTDTLVRIAQQHRARLGEYDQMQLDYLAALLASDGERAIRAVARAASAAPSSRAAYNYGRDLIAMDRAAEARRVLEAIDPDRGAMKGWQSYWTQLTHALHLVGDHQAEIAAARQMRKRFPSARVAYVLEARALAHARKFDELDSLLRVTSDLPASEYWSHGAELVTAGEELLAHGDSARGGAYLTVGAAWLTRELTVEPGKREHRYWLGTALYSLGAWRAASAMFDDLHRDFPERLGYRGLAAIGRARLGQLRVADSILGPAPKFARAEHTSFRARLAAIAGDHERARILLRQSVSEVLSGFAWVHATANRDFGVRR